MTYLHFFNAIKGALGETQEKKEFVEGCQQTIDDVLKRFPDKKRSDPEVQTAINQAVVGYMVEKGYLIEVEGSHRFNRERLRRGI